MVGFGIYSIYQAVVVSLGANFIIILLIDFTELLYGCLQQILGLGAIGGFIWKKRLRSFSPSCVSSVVFQPWLPVGFHFARLGCPDFEFGSCVSSCQRPCYPSQESIHGRFVLHNV